MTAPRENLNALLQEVLGSGNVYFQPPASITMKYPCIVYNLDNMRSDFANNKPYRHAKRYSVTVIDRDPDSEIPDRIAALPLTSFTRAFTTDNLNHYNFSLYF